MTAFFLLICIILSLCLPVSGDDTVITLSAQDDFAAVLDAVPDGGTICIADRFTVPQNFEWKEHEKTITFTGGTLYFSDRNIVLGDNVSFKNINIAFPSDCNLYANGHSLYVDKDVTFVTPINLYGGGKACDVLNTDMTLLGGTYKTVYGGSLKGNVNGDVNLAIGGNFNKTLSKITHTHDYMVFGGCFNGTVRGDVNLTFGGNAKANYIYGGSSGKDSMIHGRIKLLFNGGEAMSIFGGSYDVNQRSDVYLYFTGGKVQQIFGGCEKASMNGNILVQVTGGKVSRRIYSGCYNNYDSNGWQSTINYVNGNILLMFGGSPKIRFDYDGMDLSIYAHSRCEKAPSMESAHIGYLDANAQKNNKKYMGDQDGIMSFLSDTPVRDAEHVLTYTVSGNTITQSCDCHNSAVATITTSDSIYTGAPARNVSVDITGKWYGPSPLVEYSNNTEVGTAQAKITAGKAVLNVTYQIKPAEAQTLDQVFEKENDYLIWIIFGACGLLVITAGVVTFLIIRKKRKNKEAAT